MTSRYKKVAYTAAAGLGLFLGAAGIAAAATGDTSTPPTPASETVDVDDDGVNCEDGIDSATGAECDGGPAAALADEATEAPDSEADEADEVEEVDGGGDEAVDGIDHQFEGEEVGENGDGIPDADDAFETDADDAFETDADDAFETEADD
jgi:hypothetical protein